MASCDVREAGERSKREHKNLVAVAHRRVTVTARDLHALDGAVHRPRNGRDKVPTRPCGYTESRGIKLRRPVVGRLCVIAPRSGRVRAAIGPGHWVGNRAGWTLHAKGLSCCA